MHKAHWHPRAVSSHGLTPPRLERGALTVQESMRAGRESASIAGQ
jgi:hypothetical protein